MGKSLVSCFFETQCTSSDSCCYYYQATSPDVAGDAAYSHRCSVVCVSVVLSIGTWDTLVSYSYHCRVDAEGLFRVTDSHVCCIIKW